MKSIAVIIVALLAGLHSTAQELSVMMGYGSYRMSDLKALNRSFELSSQGRHMAKTVDNFPGYLTAGVSFTLPVLNKFELGGEANLFSTGSRLSYRDYSGYLNIDQKIYGISLGVLPSIRLLESGKFTVTLLPKIGVTVSKLTLQDKISVGATASSENLDFSSLNTFAEPGLRFARYFGSGKNQLGVGLRAGYYFSISRGKLFYESSDDYYLLIGRHPAHSDWSGIRADICLTRRF